MRLIGAGGLPWQYSTQASAYQRKGHGFDPWSGKMPQAVEQLSPSSTTTELVLQSHGAKTREAPTHTTGESP